jgi:hypothetical protein
MNNRRTAPRYFALENRVWIGWWANTAEFQTIAAHVDDISVGGAKLVTTVPPSEGQDVWVRLGNPLSFECVRANVLEVDTLEDGVFGVRLAFAAPCPVRFLQTAVNGLSQPRSRTQLLRKTSA